MNAKLETVLTTTLALGALAVAASAVKSSFFSDRERTQADPEYIPGWEHALEIGHTLEGPVDAPITVVALIDLQCPSCAGFYRGFRDMMTTWAGQIQVVYVHFPLDYHEQALAAAQAAECAAESGAFARFAAVAYEMQDSLGKMSWGALARVAGISDTSYISRCARNTAPSTRVQAGIAYGRTVGVSAVPTILVNGWKYREPPSREVLAEAFDALLQGRDPQRQR